MKNVANRAVAVDAAAPQLSAYRRALMDTLAAAPVITTAEYDTAVQNILACQCLTTLQKWYRNCIREIARREEAAGVPAPVEYATPAQQEEIAKLYNSVWILRKEKVQIMLALPRYTYADAVTCIGDLWAKILHRQERAAEGQENASSSFSEAC